MRASRETGSPLRNCAIISPAGKATIAAWSDNIAMPPQTNAMSPAKVAAMRLGLCTIVVGAIALVIIAIVPIAIDRVALHIDLRQHRAG